MSADSAQTASPAATAVPGDVLSFDDLSCDRLDVPRFINASLHALPATASLSLSLSSFADSDASAESRVSLLFSRLQSHAQAIAGRVEDAIAQALVRLPRTGLEVSRMITEAQQLEQQLQRVQDTTEPAVRAAAQPCVAKLNACKRTQEKLVRCAEMLRKASEVDARMREMDDVMRRLRAAPAEVDVDAVAESIREVRGNLAELRKLEPNFGEKQLDALSRCEQSVQQAVEAECSEQLRRRDAQRAARLLKVLDTIDRADAVLQQYAVDAMVRERERITELLSATVSAPARAAEVLRVQLIPALSHVLADEMDYALRVADATKPAADSCAQAVMQMIVREASSAVTETLSPILERTERNADLVACYEAVRHLSLSGEGAAPAAEDTPRDILWRHAAADFAAEMTRLFAQPQTIKAFAQREIERVAVALSDTQCTAQRDRFRAAMEAVSAAVGSALRFFPDETLPICVGPWRVALVDAVAILRPQTEQCAASELLRRFAAAHIIVHPLVLAEQRNTAEFLGTQSLSLLSLLSLQLWEPLIEAVDSCAAACQRAVKRAVAAPVIAKAAGYHSQCVWSGAAQTKRETLVPYAQAQAAPSEIVRALGEAIVEIPLALEALRGDSDAQLCGMDELLEEVADAWLDDIVRMAVEDFVGEKIACVVIDFPGDVPDSASKEAAAVEQLATDLGYLRSILSAVSDESFDALERTLARLKIIALPVGKPIVIKHLIADSVSV